MKPVLSESVLGQTIHAALTEWHAQKVAGATLAERVRNLEQTLRAAWPQTREWKYLCETCRDVGLQMQTCPGDATCGRTKRHLPHEFGTPCWCQAGDRFKVKARTEQTEVEAAAKIRKKQPTRWGR